MNDEEYLIIDEDENSQGKNSKILQKDNWKILIVDDDEVVRNLSKRILRDFEFREKSCEIFEAASAKKAKEVLTNQPGIHVILLDVVMESNDSGLELVKYIREDLNNNSVRIILRTGQPGHAPESTTMDCYQINDYRKKDELSEDSLKTAIKSNLKTFMELEKLNNVSDSALLDLVGVKNIEGDIGGKIIENDFYVLHIKLRYSQDIKQYISIAQIKNGIFEVIKQNKGAFILVGESVSCFFKELDLEKVLQGLMDFRNKVVKDNEDIVFNYACGISYGTLKTEVFGEHPKFQFDFQGEVLERSRSLSRVSDINNFNSIILDKKIFDEFEELRDSSRYIGTCNKKEAYEYFGFYENDYKSSLRKNSDEFEQLLRQFEELKLQSRPDFYEVKGLQTSLKKIIESNPQDSFANNLYRQIIPYT